MAAVRIAVKENTVNRFWWLWATNLSQKIYIKLFNYEYFYPVSKENFVEVINWKEISYLKYAQSRTAPLKWGHRKLVLQWRLEKQLEMIQPFENAI